jgi:hypothetical protein
MAEDLNDDWWESGAATAAAPQEHGAVESADGGNSNSAGEEGDSLDALDSLDAAQRKRKGAAAGAAGDGGDGAPQKKKKKPNKALAKRKDALAGRDAETAAMVRRSAADACSVLWDRFFLGAFAAGTRPSDVVLAGLCISAAHVEHGMPGRTDAGDLADLARFVQTVCRPLLPRKPLKAGRVRHLVVTSAAGRAVALIRALQDVGPGAGKVGKLFAKHMKIEEQQAVGEYASALDITAQHADTLNRCSIWPSKVAFWRWGRQIGLRPSLLVVCLLIADSCRPYVI